MSWRRPLVFAVIAVSVAACGGEDAPGSRSEAEPTAAASDDVAQLTFAPALDIDLDSMTQLPSGVYVQDLQTGRGALATAGKRVVVEYRAWLPDGTLYEERPNADGWGPSEFPLDAGAPVPGLVDGIDGMRAGGLRRIVVPPERGYGLVGRPAGVPAGSALVFQVRVVRVREE